MAKANGMLWKNACWIISLSRALTEQDRLSMWMQPQCLKHKQRQQRSIVEMVSRSRPSPSRATGDHCDATRDVVTASRCCPPLILPALEHRFAVYLLHTIDLKDRVASEAGRKRFLAVHKRGRAVWGTHVASCTEVHCSNVRKVALMTGSLHK